jgi:hypothetical protein
MNQKLYDTLDKLSKLPEKFININVILVALMIQFFVLYGAVAVAQLNAVNACITPIPSSLVK